MTRMTGIFTLGCLVAALTTGCKDLTAPLRDDAPPEQATPLDAELAGALVADAIARLVPALGEEDAAAIGALLDAVAAGIAAGDVPDLDARLVALEQELGSLETRTPGDPDVAALRLYASALRS